MNLQSQNSPNSSLKIKNFFLERLKLSLTSLNCPFCHVNHNIINNIFACSKVAHFFSMKLNDNMEPESIKFRIHNLCCKLIINDNICYLWFMGKYNNKLSFNIPNIDFSNIDKLHSKISSLMMIS